MLKKMRIRFVSLAMAAFSAVILLLLVSINAWNYQTTTTQLDSTISVLKDISTENITAPAGIPSFPGNNFSPEVRYMVRFFSVSYDEDGTLTDVNQDFIASVSAEDAEDYGDTVKAVGNTSGFYNSYRYQVFTTDSGTLIVFLNAERELQSIRNLTLITCMIALLSLLLVFVLTFLFSKRAIAPFARNVAAQKEFITNASHELKTPLTAISTSADVLAMEYPDDEWVQNIQGQSAQLSSLISNLVMLSRLDEERPLPEKTILSLSDTAWEISEPFSSRAQASGKQLIVDIEDDVSVLADQSTLQQLISVLLDNALKYSDESGKITLHVYHLGKKACLEVTNPCRGCSKINTSKLFDRFYRADTSHENRINGNGIGLSIAKAAAETNGASISADTANDEITFRVSF